MTLNKQGVALRGRNCTVPPCSDWLRVRPGGGPPPTRLTDEADRRQRAKQYWPIRRPSNKY